MIADSGVMVMVGKLSEGGKQMQALGKLRIIVCQAYSGSDSKYQVQNIK